jgi:hypothetical protein
MVGMSRRRSLAFVAIVATVAAGCGSARDGADETIPPVTPVPTIGGVGLVPAVPSAVREPVVVVRPPLEVDGTTAQLIGDIVDGNRVIMIGDSILASTSSRYGNQMCEALEPLGWQVAIEAEPSRFVDFGNTVLARQLPDDVTPEADWDVAVVFLGSNYRGDAVRYEAELVEILDRLDPRPVLLLTVSEYRPNYVDVNVVVNRLGAERDNVTVLDWKTISETPGVLSSDRLHPTDAGRRVLAESVAAALGAFPDGVGDCLRSTFRNDSAVGSGNSNTVLGRPSSGSSSSGSSSSGSGSSSVTTTSRPTTSATTSSVPAGGGTGEASGTVPDGGSETTTPAGTAPPVTQPPVTTAPPVTTQPPAPAPGGGGSGDAGGESGAGAGAGTDTSPDS